MNTVFGWPLAPMVWRRGSSGNIRHCGLGNWTARTCLAVSGHDRRGRRTHDVN